MLDLIGSIIDLHMAGSKAHAYTKVPEFVRMMGNTGMMINMSMIPAGEWGIDDNGNVTFDSNEGMPLETMLALRDAFPETAGNIMIGINDEQIRKLMLDDRIDYIIPYHTSGAKEEFRTGTGIAKWHDYSQSQNEKNTGKGRQAPALREWFDVKEGKRYGSNGRAYMDKAAQKYVDLCAERGITPKFSQFLATDAEGNWVAPEGYWKLLIDRKMVNHITGEIIEQRVVEPRFNEQTMLALDCKVPYGDAVIAVGDAKMGGLSTYASLFILNTILIEGAKKARERGVEPPVYISGNIEGGTARNVALEERYFSRIKHL